MYLLTNECTNIAGVYKITIKRIKDDTGVSREEVNAILEKFAATKKALYFQEYIIIPKWIKHQKINEKSGKIKLGVDAVLRSLPDNIKSFIAKEGNYEYDLSFLGADRVSGKGEKTSKKRIGYPKNEQKTDRVSENDGKSANDSDLDSDKDRDSDSKNPCGSKEPPDKKPAELKPKKPPLREREPENEMEQVEKAYLQNWDELYRQKRVETPDPAITYGKTRNLLKMRFAVFKPEQIIQAINNGMNDTLAMQNGYSLSAMLGDSMFNRLINARSPPVHRIAADNKPTVEKLKLFREE